MCLARNTKKALQGKGKPCPHFFKPFYQDMCIVKSSNRKTVTPYFVVGTGGGVGLTVGLLEAPPEGLGFGGVVGAGVTLMAVI